MRLRTLAWVAGPLWSAFAVVVLALAPLLGAVARLSRLSGRRQPAAVVRLLLVYVIAELEFLAGAARQRRRAGTPPALRRANYALLLRYLDRLVSTAMRTLRLRLDVALEPSAARALHGCERPVLVFSRHAGPGDSFLLVHLLLSRFGREPSIVLKELLTADPVLGSVCRTLPMAPIGADKDAACDAVLHLAQGLTPASALLLFPEGGNFTPERRARAIDWLRRAGDFARARHAERLEHLVAPRPGGVLAALEGAPGADVVFTAHTGLGQAAKGLGILRRLPHDTTVAIRLWHVDAAERPVGERAQVQWLDDWWRRLDEWVEAQGAE